MFVSFSCCSLCLALIASTSASNLRFEANSSSEEDASASISLIFAWCSLSGVYAERRKNEPSASLLSEIDNLPISNQLKRRLKAEIQVYSEFKAIKTADDWAESGVWACEYLGGS